jgi:hypothetical protein
VMASKKTKGRNRLSFMAVRILSNEGGSRDASVCPLVKRSIHRARSNELN